MPWRSDLRRALVVLFGLRQHAIEEIIPLALANPPQAIDTVKLFRRGDGSAGEAGIGDKARALEVRFAGHKYEISLLPTS